MALKILLAADNSDCAVHAAKALLSHLTHFHEPCELHVLFVHLPLPLESATHHIDPDSVSRYYRDEGEARLAPVLSHLQRSGVSFTRHIHVGDVADTIVREASELGCDFICMGTHGHGVLGAAMLGSISAKVIRRTSLPILFARLAA